MGDEVADLEELLNEEAALDEAEEEPEEEIAPPKLVTKAKVETKVQKENIVPPPAKKMKWEAAPAHKAPAPDDQNKPLTQFEVQREQRRTQAMTRDVGARALCKIKAGVRQAGAQKDGRPFIPADWETVFQPTLGSYKRFILSRPDQFRIIEGAGAGSYKVKVVSNELVTAPSWSELVASKGKKGKGKGKGKDGTNGKGKYGIKGKGGKGGKEQQETVQPSGIMGSVRFPGGDGKKSGASGTKKEQMAARTSITPVKKQVGSTRPTTRAAQLLVEAAREELAAEAEADDVEDGVDEAEEEQAVGEEVDEFEGMQEEEADVAEEAAEDEDGASDAEEALQDDIEAEESHEHGDVEQGAEPEFPAGRASRHGNFIASLLVAPPSQKRPRLL